MWTDQLLKKLAADTGDTKTDLEKVDKITADGEKDTDADEVVKDKQVKESADLRAMLGIKEAGVGSTILEGAKKVFPTVAKWFGAKGRGSIGRLAQRNAGRDVRKLLTRAGLIGVPIGAGVDYLGHSADRYADDVNQTLSEGIAPPPEIAVHNQTRDQKRQLMQQQQQRQQAAELAANQQKHQEGVNQNYNQAANMLKNVLIYGGIPAAAYGGYRMLAGNDEEEEEEKRPVR